jgi:hypothetical protein
MKPEERAEIREHNDKALIVEGTATRLFIKGRC